jgi:two-component system nitrate/nitrite response regulator NarL
MSRPPAHLEPILVLIVDDDPRLRAAICDTVALESDLELLGEAPDAAHALVLAAGARAVVALVDVPGANICWGDSRRGLPLVRALSRLAGCRVVAMSLRAAAAAPALAAGAVAFVEKGEDVEAMLSAIRRVGGARS